MNLFENLQLLQENSKYVVQYVEHGKPRYIIKNVDDFYCGTTRIDFATKFTKEDADNVMDIFKDYKISKEFKLIEVNDEEIKTEAPKEFFKKVSDAKETLSQFSKEKVSFVKKAYDDVLADISDAFISDRGTSSSRIKNDYKSLALEDNIVTEEEFDTIYKALEIIGVFHSQANA